MRHSIRTTLVAVFLLLFPAGVLFAHSKDISYAVLHVDEASVNGELFLNGYQVAQLAQQFNLDLSEITPEALTNLLRSYFTIHFQITNRAGTALEKSILDFRNSDPSEFLATGIWLIFYVKLEQADFPLTFTSDIFFEFSTTQTNKLIFKDKLGREFPNSRQVLLTPERTSFTFDLAAPDFSFYEFDLRDTDRDGISDQYEALYGLDPDARDTDQDGFSDFEEFFAGWDPFDATPGADQSQTK
ncbi:MAG TPA: hypothetical protein ENN69_09090, partial [Spirochaetia bacterium]|nr:hypothetical protein [Spirochaetia bacterium]